MKKLFLLLASGSIAFAANAQERTSNMANALIPMGVDFATQLNVMKSTMKSNSAGTANKTTAAPRWYSYVDYFDQNESSMSSSIAGGNPYLWGSNQALMTYSSGVDTAGLISISLVVDPAFTTPTNNGFNEWAYYPGEMKITPSDAYQIDSIVFSGGYLTNPAKMGTTANVIDTLRVSVVHGSGASTADIYEVSTSITAGILANYGTVGSPLKNQRIDANSRGLAATGSTVQTVDILLDNTTTPPSWAADTAGGVFIGRVGFATPISVAAGEMVGVTVSFISGDASFTPYDTVFIGSPAVPPVKYNMFRPTVAFKGVTGTPQFPSYNATDRNTGGFVDEAPTGFYVPHWFWSAGTAAASNQYPLINIHAICSACGVVEEPIVNVKNVSNVKRVGAFPNPSSTELNVPFILNSTANVTVTLTNMLGQVVATQNMGTVTMGTAEFNTANLANGVYTYTVISNGERTTGRVAIAH